ncbi:MAG: hypothetical protein HC896_14660 [Bacteroidales bacterium]|nr:hypothetical protein [Bacteroidales bacterium]
MVASGDVLIVNGAAMPPLPKADVVCLGIWKEPEKCTNHGVFFLERDAPEALSFMLQKPSASTICDKMHRYNFLIDIGIWLFSEKAIDLLMKKCGWNSKSQSYTNGLPNFYDMYSQFGEALGMQPLKHDNEINSLDVKIVPLNHGEFYHFGTSKELIESSESLQNRIINQQEIWHRKVKPHPSIFYLKRHNANTFTQDHKNIWVENTYMPAGWK